MSIAPPVAPLSDVDRVTLRPIVAAALQNDEAEVLEWHVTPIVKGRASSAGVYRLNGMARVQGERVPWSVVLKEAIATAQSEYSGNNASEDITSSLYWKRELLVYQSGLLNMLPDGIRGPHCYRIDEDATSARIWMEDVREGVGEIWPLSHYGVVARHFGRFSGTFMRQGQLPEWPWLLRDYLGRAVEASDWPQFYEHYPSLRDNPLIRRGWNDDLVADFQRIWQQRTTLLDALARLPQTLMHNDSGRKNLVAHRRADGELETVALDWAQPTIAPVGSELACIVAQPLYWFNGVGPEDLLKLDAITFENYVAGLRDVGWHGDPRLARLGYTAAMPLRVGFVVFNFEWAALDEATHKFIEHRIGHSMDEISAVMLGLRHYLVACVEEAVALIDSAIVDGTGIPGRD